MNASICFQTASFITQHALFNLCDLAMRKYRPRSIQQRVYSKWMMHLVSGSGLLKISKNKVEKTKKLQESLMNKKCPKEQHLLEILYIFFFVLSTTFHGPDSEFWIVWDSVFCHQSISVIIFLQRCHTAFLAQMIGSYCVLAGTPGLGRMNIPKYHS